VNKWAGTKGGKKKKTCQFMAIPGRGGFGAREWQNGEQVVVPRKYKALVYHKNTDLRLGISNSCSTKVCRFTLGYIDLLLHHTKLDGKKWATGWTHCLGLDSRVVQPLLIIAELIRCVSISQEKPRWQAHPTSKER
jgi:hypothetical protein